jgi:CubicO group peptidase (beta-lactamase class C family)
VPSLSEYYSGTLRAQFEPGQRWIYSNHAYALLGQLIEEVTGEPFPDYMRLHVFTPLGMDGTDYVLSEDRRQELAIGYELRGGRPAPAKPRDVIVRPAGSVFSTTSDLGRYLEFLIDPGSDESAKVLDRGTVRDLLRPHYQMHPELPGMGLGFAVDRLGTHQLAWHNGAWEGFASCLLVAPDAEAGVAIVSNTRTTALDRLGRTLMRELLDVPEQPKRPQPAQGPAPLARARDLTGVYEPVPRVGIQGTALLSPLRAVEVFSKDGHLAIRPLLRRTALRLHQPDASDPLVFQFMRDGELQTAVFHADPRGVVDALFIGPHRLGRRPGGGGLRSALRMISRLEG